MSVNVKHISTSDALKLIEQLQSLVVQKNGIIEALHGQVKTLQMERDILKKELETSKAQEKKAGYIRSKRKVWVRPGRTDTWWQNFLTGKLLEDEWKNNLRMNRQDFDELVTLILPFYTPRSDAVRKDILSLQKRVALTLYYLKDLGSYSMTCNAFGCSKATVSLCVKEICGIISANLGPKFIQYPSTYEDVVSSTEGFLQKFGFPQVVGCIDGTHIPIQQPNENAHDYFSYKMKYTINCQAICNHNGKFIDVEIKWPGSVHDARMFANSEVQKSYSGNKIDLFYKELLPGEIHVPQLLLGDPAYPLLPYMMKEYDTCRSNEEVIFNQMLRSARNQIECAFGRLKARWRILQRPLDTKLVDVPNLIYACFVLHNFCEREKAESLNETEIIIAQEHGQQPSIDRTYSYFTTEGRMVRESITKYFNEYL